MGTTPTETIGESPDLRNFVLKAGLQAIAEAKKTGCQHDGLVINVRLYPGTEDLPGGPYVMGICSQCTSSRTAKQFVFPQLVPGQTD